MSDYGKVGFSTIEDKGHQYYIYGSDRLGMYAYPDTVYPVPSASTADFQPIWHGYHKYELKNHLGNVMTVVNGQKIAIDANSDNTIDYYQANIEEAYDYSPFGVIRKSFEPNYTSGTTGVANPLAPDFMWCMDGDGTEKYGSGHDATFYNTTGAQNHDANTGGTSRAFNPTSSPSIAANSLLRSHPKMPLRVQRSSDLETRMRQVE